MRKYLLILVALLAMVGAFRGGLEVGERSWEQTASFAFGQAELSEKHARLSDLRGCLFAIDSATLHFVRTPDKDALITLVWRLGQCDTLLQTLGKTENDEETDRILAEAQLFYEGYAVTLNEIIGRETMLATLHNKIMMGNLAKVEELHTLEAEQTEQIRDAGKFLIRLQALIVRAW